MRIAKVIGSLTLNRCHPSFIGSSLRIARPMSLDNLTGAKPQTAEPLVVWDDLSSGLGDNIAVSEGAEAAQPFRPEVKPVDAYNAAILDSVRIESP